MSVPTPMAAGIAIPGVLAGIWLIAQPARAADCPAEAAALLRAETELPIVDMTPPLHRALVCITLETLVDFGRRVGAHVGRCPASPYARKVATWDKARENHSAQFRKLRCRPTF